MWRTVSLVVSSSLIVLGGCTSTSQLAAGAPEAALRDTRAFIGKSADDCPQSGGKREAISATLGALAVPIIGSAVKEAVSALGSAIEEAAQDKERTISAVAASKDILGASCVVVIRGTFGPWPEGAQDTTKKAKLFKRVGLVGDPDLFAELVFQLNEKENNVSAFLLDLRWLEYRRALVDSWWSRRRGLVVSAVFQTPAKKSEKDESAAFAVGAISLEDITVGSALDYIGALKEGKTTAWMPLPVRPDKTATGPYSVFVSVTETREGSKFMKFLSGVFKPNEETIAKEGTKVIIDFTGLKKD